MRTAMRRSSIVATHEKVRANYPEKALQDALFQSYVWLQAQRSSLVDHTIASEKL